MKAIIVDDEHHARENLYSILKEYCPDVGIAGLADSIKTAVKLIKETKPDVLFLDIKLSGSSGFELLELFDEMDFEVIFVTAYDNYAIKAIKFSALDYILKPIDPAELQSAVLKLKNKINRDQKSCQLKMLIENLSRGKSYNKIVISSESNIEYLAISSIIRLQGESNYTRIYLEGERSLIASKSLIEFEELLTDLGFFRVHKTHMVNLLHIKTFHKSGSSYLILTNQSKIPVSRRRKAALIERIKHQP
jgi:two-component system LytT family response regulator